MHFCWQETLDYCYKLFSFCKCVSLFITGTQGMKSTNTKISMEAVMDHNLVEYYIADK